MTNTRAQESPKQESAVNQWLEEHPLVLGTALAVLGMVLVLTGIGELRRGKTTDKYGIEVKGKAGKGLSLLRIVAGFVVLGIGMYKLVAR